MRQVGTRDGSTIYLVAVINPDFFGNDYELTLADASRSAGMFSIDGVMIAGTSGLQTAPGKRIGGHRIFASILPAKESGSFVGPGIDGEKVVTAFRVLRKRPLVVVVERRYANVMAEFRSTLFWTSGVTALSLLVVCAMVVMAWRSLKGHESVSEALEATRLEIAASERDLRVLVESVHELIFRADATGKIVFVNGRWKDLTNLSASEVIGKRVMDLCRADEREACRKLFSSAEACDQALLVHVRNATGAYLTLQMSVSPVVDQAGRTEGFAGFAVDVTEREAAQQALQSQLKFTAQLLEISPTPLFVKDDCGRFTTVNRAWLELMKLTLPDVLGRTSTDLYGDDAPRHADHDTRLMLSGERVSYENRLLVEGCPARDTVVSKVRFTRADGTPAGIVGSIVDVTEFREAERNYRKARGRSRAGPTEPNPTSSRTSAMNCGLRCRGSSDSPTSVETWRPSCLTSSTCSPTSTPAASAC